MPKILLVEDDTRIAIPLQRALELERYVVDVASDGEEGWDYLRQYV
jgi:DNA-binding response OmpR family regulator